jgi:hypothetical protein
MKTNFMCALVRWNVRGLPSVAHRYLIRRINLKQNNDQSINQSTPDYLAAVCTGCSVAIDGWMDGCVEGWVDLEWPNEEFVVDANNQVEIVGAQQTMLRKLFIILF